MNTMRRALTICAFLLLAGCAARQAVVIELPPPSPVELTPVDLPEFRLRVALAPGWAPEAVNPGDRHWKGPKRAIGRGELRLIEGADYPQSLAALVTGAARVHGVGVPTKPRATRVAGRDALYVSGVKGPGQRQVLVFGWQDGDATYLLLASWVAPDDGAAVAAMIGALAFLETPTR